MKELTSLKNIGVEMARKLQSVDINSAEDLIAGFQIVNANLCNKNAEFLQMSCI